MSCHERSWCAKDSLSLALSRLHFLSPSRPQQKVKPLQYGVSVKTHIKCITAAIHTGAASREERPEKGVKEKPIEDRSCGSRLGPPNLVAMCRLKLSDTDGAHGGERPVTASQRAVTQPNVPRLAVKQAVGWIASLHWQHKQRGTIELGLELILQDIQ